MTSFTTALRRWETVDRIPQLPRSLLTLEDEAIPTHCLLELPPASVCTAMLALPTFATCAGGSVGVGHLRSPIGGCVSTMCGVRGCSGRALRHLNGGGN